MGSDTCATPLTFEAIVDYWADDLPAEESRRLEEHMFACDWCARQLAEGSALAGGVAAAVRAGRFQSVVSEALLNQLARDGVRLRSYTIGAGEVVPCTIWSDDDLSVNRLRVDLTGVDSVTIVTTLESGQEMSRLADIPVRPGQSELIRVTSAALIRRLPAGRVRTIVTGRSGSEERVIAEYILEHGGAFERRSS